MNRQNKNNELDTIKASSCSSKYSLSNSSFSSKTLKNKMKKSLSRNKIINVKGK